MGKKLDALLGRNTFKTSKFKSLINLAISRLAVLKNHRQVRCNNDRSDVLQLLQQGHPDRALLRVEQVMKEQNMLDVLAMMEGYFNLLAERVRLVEQNRVCPDELKEAISSLLFASSRCGEFPELQEIRAVLTSRYGKEFAARAIELRNNCGVNAKMIQKLSTRQPDLEGRMKVLKEIASENNIALQPEEDSDYSEEILDVGMKQSHPVPETPINSDSTNLHISLEGENDGLSDSFKARKKYRDVADAAQAAFESAAYAAAAARAAVELSRSDPHNPDNQNSPRNLVRKMYDKEESLKLKSKTLDIQKENEAADLKAGSEAELKRIASTSSSDSAAEVDLGVKTMSFSLDADNLTKQLEKDITLVESDDDSVNKSSTLQSAIPATGKPNKHIPSTIQAGIEVISRDGYSTTHTGEGSGIQGSQRLNIKKGPISVRTKQVRGY